MIDLFYQGGVLFMSLLTIVNIAVIVLSAKKMKDIFLSEPADPQQELRSISSILELGRFGLILGVLGQLIGLYSAFKAIEEMGSISMQMLAGGLKVSSITTMYGLLILLIAYVFYFVLRGRLK